MKKNAVFVLIVGIAVAFVAVGLLQKHRGAAVRRIAVIPKGVSSPFWETVRAGAVKACEEEGFEISWNGPEVESDRERQIQIVEDFIARKVSGVVLAPNDREALVPLVEKLYARKIPCAIIDSDIATDKYVTFAASDNYRGGVLAAERMSEILGGKGNVIVLRFMPGSASTTNREEGFIETIEKRFPEIKVVDTKYGMATTETCIQAAEDLLTKHDDLDGVFACNNHTTVGAVQALRSRNKIDRVKVIGFDSDETLVKMLRDGALDSIVVQNPYKMGYEGVKAVVAALRGKHVPKRIDTGVQLATKQRLDDPELKALLDLR